MVAAARESGMAGQVPATTREEPNVATAGATTATPTSIGRGRVENTCRISPGPPAAMAASAGLRNISALTGNSPPPTETVPPVTAPHM